jgi:2,3-diaminopropionate biosynthesis protein SbnB
VSEFAVVSGKHVADLLLGQEHQVVEVVRRTYLAHHIGATVNPDSYFLRFPDKPDSRIIALPAYLGGDIDRAGIKWISSFPANVRKGQQRASAVLVLNDYATGYPIALLEASRISAARTAASAALAALTLTVAPPQSFGVVGAGVIGRTIVDYLIACGLAPQEAVCHDLDAASAEHLVRHLTERHRRPARSGGLDEALDADLVVLATTALTPYIGAGQPLRAGQLLLNISLRDLQPELLLAADNVLDDVDHCLKAATSPHLAEQLSGARDFVTGTLAQALRGELVLDPDLPTIFSPFGLGVLDIAVGHHVLGRARDSGVAVEVPDFLGTTERW